MNDRLELYIKELKEEMFDAVGYRCKCEQRAVYFAHRMAKSKTNKIIAGKRYVKYFKKPWTNTQDLIKYGDLVIQHPFNLVPVCTNGDCNDRENIGNAPEESKVLMEEILEDLARFIKEKP